MIILSEENILKFERPSSKGNQLKWCQDDVWYKADYAGYEALAEYMVSHLLCYSSLKPSEFVLYDLEEIALKNQTLRGCSSKDFLGDRRILTIERLFKSSYGVSAHESVFSVSNKRERMEYLVERVEKVTGLKEFGAYLAKTVTIDALFLNEDRHLHNLAVLQNSDGDFEYCPLFDFGAGLLSDTTMDYPLSGNWEEMMTQVRSKTFTLDFEEQLDIAESLYGRTIKFNFSERDVLSLLESASIYPKEIVDRVQNLILEKRRQYNYLW